jgi:excisionase family DNA binding protein
MTLVVTRLSVRVAAMRLGIAHSTLKQWIYAGRVRTIQTVGDHRRIPEEETGSSAGQRRQAKLGSRKGIAWTVDNFPVADSFNRRRERDYSTGDIPHVLVTSAVWDIPVGASRARNESGVVGACAAAGDRASAGAEVRVLTLNRRLRTGNAGRGQSETSGGHYRC